MPEENGVHSAENGGNNAADINKQASDTPMTAETANGLEKPLQNEGSSGKMNGDVNENNNSDAGEQKLSELKLQTDKEEKAGEISIEKASDSPLVDVTGEKAGGDVENQETVTSASSNQKREKKLSPKHVTPAGGRGDVPKTNESKSGVSRAKTCKSEEMKRTHKTKSKDHSSPKSSQKKLKKGIFFSYSPDGSFTERRFVCTTVKQFKENNLGEDIWFDKDEQNTDNPSWFSQRMEAVEKCRAAICILSESFLQCPVSVYELRSLLERCKSSSLSGLPSPKVFVIRYEDVELPKRYASMVTQMVDITGPESLKLSLYERASSAIGSLYKEVESCASINASYVQPTPERELTKKYKTKKLCRWTINDVQSWLTDLGMREFYRNCFLENGIDGFLLMSIMDNDLSESIGIDSRVARKKLLQQIIAILEKEHKLPENWHLRARTLRSKPDNVYLSYDPADVQLTQNLKSELKKKNLMVTCHKKLGQSKDEFLEINGPQIATAKYMVIVLTEAACQSPFVFHEVLFADWLGKTLVTAMFKNSWHKLRSSLKALLGDCPAIDFETRMFPESMDILQHQIKPLRKVPGVVLEQSYLNRMRDGIRPLQVMASAPAWLRDTASSEPTVFLSYQWDVHNKVQEIKRILESNHIPCWLDNSPTITHHQQQRGYSGTSTHSSVHSSVHSSIHSSASARSTLSSADSETMQGTIQLNMKSSTLVLCCMTPRYLQSDNCIKDLLLAETLQKPIIPVLLRFIPWPPDTGPSQVKKLLARTSHIDLSNDKLFKQNFHILIDKIRKFMGGKH